MRCESAKLGSLVDIKTGAPMSRAKKLAENDTELNVRVLVPAAISSWRIDDTLVVDEVVSKVKSDLFTQEGDVVLKTSTPYDCVYIDKAHAGLLVTSFSLILRPRTKSKIDMRYLAAYLGQTEVNRELITLSKGISIQLLKKKDLENFAVLVPPRDVQLHLAKLFESTSKRKELCYEIAKKSDLLLQSEFARTVRIVD